MYSICGHYIVTARLEVRGDWGMGSFSNRLADILTFRFGETWGSGMGRFDGLPMGFYGLPIDTYGPSLTVFELFRWLQKHFCLSAHPSDLDAMTNTTLYATASTSGKNGQVPIGI